MVEAIFTQLLLVAFDESENIADGPESIDKAIEGLDEGEYLNKIFSAKNYLLEIESEKAIDTTKILTKIELDKI